MALSADGTTLAVGATTEDSNATTIDGDQANDLASNAGAVYVFVRDGAGAWSKQAYIKSSNLTAYDTFGRGLDLSADGDTLVVGAPSWSQATYVKASNPDPIDRFGSSVALSGREHAGGRCRQRGEQQRGHRRRPDQQRHFHRGRRGVSVLSAIRAVHDAAIRSPSSRTYALGPASTVPAERKWTPR